MRIRPRESTMDLERMIRAVMVMMFVAALIWTTYMIGLFI